MARWSHGWACHQGRSARQAHAHAHMHLLLADGDGYGWDVGGGRPPRIVQVVTSEGMADGGLGVSVYWTVRPRILVEGFAKGSTR